MKFLLPILILLSTNPLALAESIYVDTIPGTNYTLAQAREMCEKWGKNLVDPKMGKPLSQNPILLIHEMEEEMKKGNSALEMREKAKSRPEVRVMARESLKRGLNRSRLLDRAGKLVMEMDQRGFYEKSGVFKACAYSVDDLYIQLENLKALSQPVPEIE